MTSRGRWVHFGRGGSAESDVILGQGTAEMSLGAGELNRLTVLFNPLAGLFIVNGDTVAQLDLSLAAAQVAGDVRVIAGVVVSDVYNGAESEFFNLTSATE